MITANSAWSTRRRRSSRLGKKDPVRDFGIRGSGSPDVVVRVRGLDPLRRSGPLAAALPSTCTDHRGQLRLDQRLVDRLCRRTDRSSTSAAFIASSTSSSAAWSEAIVLRVLS